MPRKNTRIPASQVRQEFSDMLNRAAYGRERIVMSRRGKPVAAIVSVDDLHLLETCEGRARRRR